MPDDPLVGDGAFLLAAYEVLLTRDSCECSCHETVQPGLVPCPWCPQPEEPNPTVTPTN